MKDLGSTQACKQLMVRSTCLRRDFGETITGALLCFCIMGCVWKVKPSALTWGPNQPLGGNPFPPSDHRGHVILNLRLLLWHAGMSPLRLSNTHTHRHTQVILREFLAYKTGKYIPQRERDREKRKRETPLPRLWCLTGDGMTACYQHEGIWFSGFKCAMIDSLMTDTHTLSCSLITVYILSLCGP